MSSEHPRSGDGTATAPWSQAAEDRAGRSGSGRMVGRLLTPVLAVVPWWLTVAGCLMLADGEGHFRYSYETNWALLLGGALVLLLSGLLWAALTAWSSVGTTVAGLCTFAVGLFLMTGSGIRLVSKMGLEGPIRLEGPLYVVASATTFVTIGSLLLAAGLGAAAARRLGRRAA